MEKITIILGIKTYPVVVPITISHSREPANAPINPKTTALGAKLKIIGQSSAGRAPGTSRVPMPLNAGTISPINMRTPSNTTAIPPVNSSDCLSAKI
ncbi:hypothetical protein SODG_002325 [Sodalis praecaptivus]